MSTSENPLRPDGAMHPNTQLQSMESRLFDLANKAKSADVCSLKIEINALVWKALPGNTTIDRADNIALKVLELILEERASHSQRSQGQ